MAGRCEQYSNERFGDERPSPALRTRWLHSMQSWFTCYFGAAPKPIPARTYRARQTSMSLRDATRAEEISYHLTNHQAPSATHLDTFSPTAVGQMFYHRLSLPLVQQRVAPDPSAHTSLHHSAHHSAPQQECALWTDGGSHTRPLQPSLPYISAPPSASSSQQPSLFAPDSHLVAWSAPGGTGFPRTNIRKSAASDAGAAQFRRCSSTAIPSSSLAASRSAGQEPCTQRDHSRRGASSKSHSVSCEQLWLDPPTHIPRSLSMCMVEPTSGSGTQSSTPAMIRCVARSGSSSTGQVILRHGPLTPLTPSEQREVRRQRLLRNLNLLNGSGILRAGSPIPSGSGAVSGSGALSGSGVQSGNGLPGSGGALSGSGNALLGGSISAPAATRDSSTAKHGSHSLPGRHLGRNSSGVVEASGPSQDEGLAVRGCSSNAGRVCELRQRQSIVSSCERELDNCFWPSHTVGCHA